MVSLPSCFGQKVKQQLPVQFENACLANHVMLCYNWCCDMEKRRKKRSFFGQTRSSPHTVHLYCHCLIMEKSEAHVAVLWLW